MTKSVAGSQEWREPASQGKTRPEGSHPAPQEQGERTVECGGGGRDSWVRWPPGELFSQGCGQDPLEL